jgi:hypothetical protein
MDLCGNYSDPWDVDDGRILPKGENEDEDY